MPGAGARGLGEFLHVVVGRILLDREREDGVGGARDRDQIGRIVGQLAVVERMHGEIAGRPEQQHVIVVGGQERLDRDDAVAAGLVLDHHRLAPLLRELLGEQPRADVGAGARPERHDEFDRPRRPALRLRRGRDERRAQQGDGGGNERLHRRHGVSSGFLDWPER